MNALAGWLAVSLWTEPNSNVKADGRDPIVPVYWANWAGTRFCDWFGQQAFKPGLAGAKMGKWVKITGPGKPGSRSTTSAATEKQGCAAFRGGSWEGDLHGMARVEWSRRR